MLYKRDIEKILDRYVKFPSISIMGPRQSGKTTIAQHYFKKHVFVSLENPNTREFAINDPEGFLKEYENENGIIIDEFQYAPQLLSYIQLEIDAKDRPGYFVLTGSQNYLVNQTINQSLAGRIGILTLLPLSINELKQANLLDDRAQKTILMGGYPRLYKKDIEPSDFYSSYIHTYIEKDVRQIINIQELAIFQKFIALCAGRIGQEINFSEISSLAGISITTTKRWLSLLESSFIIFFLQPYYNNYNKRLTKSPKLYFYDTGVVCELLKINSTSMITNSLFKGPLFKNLMIADLVKQFANLGKRQSLYFWRDQNDRVEVDCLVEIAPNEIKAIELKASETFSHSFFDGLKKWNNISNTSPENNIVIYAGEDGQTRNFGKLMPWKKSTDLIEKILNLKN